LQINEDTTLNYSHEKSKFSQAAGVVEENLFSGKM